ncbi:Aa_trans domain-containing protein [Meloidogyne graminicola]|uniref:Aa_trans domain-containing protein n=1 Tax=Meloidogyne graminicola TaxID=189291 RepID=A0A8S9ZPX4_9BILA|nr:Aa_trans domain-containing protein [Meloidogyne graminicola]
MNKNKGINWFITSLFIIAQLAGGGIVALPTAIIQSGLFTGILFNIILTIIAASTSIMLGKCWLILQKLWPNHYKNNYCREPYPEICLRALGPNFKYLANLFILFNQFGICVVFLLLSSKNIQNFLKSFFGINFSSLMDYSVCAPISVKILPNNNFTNYFLALGTFLFSYGGHPGFPTIQHDMKNPKEFTKSSIIAFLILLILYLPVCIFGYIAYGNSLRESIINSIQHIWIQNIVNFLITGHAIFSIIIVINPINQSAEKKFNVPQEFNIYRIIVRGFVLFLIILFAESIPTFGPLLDLSGGSTQTFTALIFPCICYLFLNTLKELNERKNNNNKFNEINFKENEYISLIDVLIISDKKILFLTIFIIVFGLLCGGAATFAAIKELTFTNFVPPCYISIFKDSLNNNKKEKIGHINCCGIGQNISIFGSSIEEICSETNLNFYN